MNKATMNLRIFTRLLSSLLLLLIISSSLMAYMLLTEARDAIEKSRLQQAHVLVKGLAEGSLDALVTKDYELLERWLKAATPIDDFSYAYFSRSDGVILSHTQPELIAKKIISLGQIKETLVRDLTYLNRPVREVIYSSYLGNKHIANTHLAYFLDTKPFYTEGIIPRLLTILIVTIGILSIAIFFILRCALKPVENLAHIIERTTNYVPDLTEDLLKRKDEVGLLAANFSSLMKKLSNAYHNLYKEKEFNQVTLDSIADGVIVIDEKSCIQYMNYVAEELTGWTTDEVKGHSIEDVFSIIDASTRKPIPNPVDKVLATSEVVYISNNILLISRDGTEYHIAESAAPIKKNDNKILGVVLVFNDVTERKKAEEKIRTLYQAIEQSPVSVMITDTSAHIEYVNRTFLHKTGYQTADVIGKNARILKSGKTSDHIYKELWRTINNGQPWQGDIMNRKKNGELFWESAQITPVFSETGEIRNFLAIREDITLRKQQEEKILYQSHFDALTGLPNRFLSLDRLSQLINEAQRNNEFITILFLDLDDFKKINDTLGHEVGDKLLIEASKRLSDGIRNGDTVGRLGGDEFIVLLGGLKKVAEAHQVIETLLELFRNAFIIDDRELMLTISVGISVFPSDGNTTCDLLRSADSAMFHAKDAGRNTYSFFTDRMNKGVCRRLALEEQMHGALERGEFYLFYQPKVDLISGKINGAEALLRWSNPLLGDVSPDEFIPVSEQIGLIIPIGQFVLKKSLEMTVIWQQLYKKTFTIAVNLSPRQFCDTGLLPFLEQVIIQSGIKGESLELEITEGVLMKGSDHIDQDLAAINNLGISIAMDDFGTGYSSLSYLRSYPFDVIKIDRSFIKEITFNIADKKLVNAAIVMAHSLGLKVVAEGIETEEQLALLVAQGCNIGQGYLFSKPLPAERIKEMLIYENNN